MNSRNKSIASLISITIAYVMAQILGPPAVLIGLIIVAFSFVWYHATTPAEKPPGRNTGEGRKS